MQRFLKSFWYAFRGFYFATKHEINFRWHLVAFFCVVLCGLFLQVSFIEWCLLFLCIGGVLALELTNTALEKICDEVSLEQKERIRIAKDCAAAAVLTFATFTVGVAAFIFLPKLNLL